ncbi:helix-turn-helix domain-containing protein [Dickeya zeae]|uniref:Transcriptional regulator n=1 Tax=Dickeya zeae TaxID=204042 RepID=A0ABX8VW75_9GAMM|nr:helix-turn-helix domain-containing protein [Dickeya zeae]MCA6988150.1 helix-turn-helix domain-containing protein [Dickeya zeae]PXW48819.1 Nlp family transcriptional regulator [Erwinia sp. AG740]QYM92189.1 transcriptional regulator [Dickeya zeae]UJR62957.1 transcriptional regulator [Dickeya zeae]
MRSRRTDWHSADIIAALRKKGTSLSAVSRQAGLSSTTLANTLYRPWPKGELLIARALGVGPEEIWPSRYYDPQTNTLIDRQKLMRNKSSRQISG